MDTSRLLVALAVGAALAASSSVSGGCRSREAPADSASAVVTDSSRLITDSLRLTTEQPGYAPGDTVVLTLANGTARTYGYNLCTAGIERLISGVWTEYRPMLAEACTMELRILEPGTSAEYRFTLDPAAPAGEYRLRTAVNDMQSGDAVGVTSSTFTVSGGNNSRGAP